jgi:hypothetical protein
LAVDLSLPPLKALFFLAFNVKIQGFFK